MSGNRNVGGNPKQSAQATGPVFRAKAQPKVSPVTGANFGYSNDPRLGETFVVVIAGPSGSKSITYHHPIGKTNLGDDDWVATPTGEVPDLVARREDPGEPSIRSKREEYRFAAAVAAGLITKDAATGEYHYPNSGKDRQATLRAARAAAKEAAQRGKRKLDPTEYLRQIPLDLKLEEDAIRAFLASDSIVSASREQFPDSGYTTRSGPLQDREQRALGSLKGKTRAQAEDAVVAKIFSL